MASIPLIPSPGVKDLTTDFQSVYTVPNNRLRAGIDAVVFNNYTEDNVTITIRVYQSGLGTIFNEIVTNEIIRAGKNYLAPSLVGQALFTGGSVQAKVSVIESVNSNITVTEIDA